MEAKLRRLKIAVILTIVLSLAVVLLVPSSLVPGVTYEVGAGGLPLALSDPLAVPQSVVDDATRLAAELFGDYPEECKDFVDQLLAVYLAGRDKDFIIFFNSGGWGWNLVEASPGWQSIFTGVQSELYSSGYTSLLLDYQRTANTVGGHLDELMSMISLHPSKAKDLAYRVDFITRHIPDLRVILAGESNGSLISDSAMRILEGNPNVYSIQTGPPFWHKNEVLSRTLVLTSNGISLDSFTQGDFLWFISCWEK